MKKLANPTDIHVGSRLRSRRLAVGLSQTDLALKAGITFQQVQKYERGVNRISASRIQEFSQVLQVPPSFFFEGGPGSDVTPSKSLPLPSSIFEFLETLDGRILADAFIRVKDKKLRRAIVALIEEVAANGL